MHLTMRSWSMNQYCLSRLWFKTHSIDLRVLDVNKITSLPKSWLYGDLLLKLRKLSCIGLDFQEDLVYIM